VLVAAGVAVLAERYAKTRIRGRVLRLAREDLVPVPVVAASARRLRLHANRPTGHAAREVGSEELLHRDGALRMLAVLLLERRSERSVQVGLDLPSVWACRFGR